MTARYFYPKSAFFVNWQRYLPTLNFALITAVILLIAGAAVSLRPDNAPVTSTGNKPAAAASPDISADKLLLPTEKAAYFQLIGGKNIFSSQRTDWQNKAQKEKETAAQVNILSPLISQLAVKGIFRAGQGWEALINNVEHRGGSKAAIAVVPGDKILGCVIDKIDGNGLDLNCSGKIIRKQINNRKDYSYIFTVGGTGKADKAAASKITAFTSKHGKAAKKSGGLNLFGNKSGKNKPNPMSTIKNLMQLMRSIDK